MLKASVARGPAPEGRYRAQSRRAASFCFSRETNKLDAAPPCRGQTTIREGITIFVHSCQSAAQKGGPSAPPRHTLKGHPTPDAIVSAVTKSTDVIPDVRARQNSVCAQSDFEIHLHGWFADKMHPGFILRADRAALLKDATGRSVRVS
jgi:hypothetical protein